MSVIEDNRINGLLAEIVAILDFKKDGYKIERTGIGSDFIAFKDEDKGAKMYVEVKYNGAELSRLQLRQKFLLKKAGGTYFVYKVSKTFLDNYKKEHGINNENMDGELYMRLRQFKQSLYDITVSHTDTQFKIILPCKCPHCNKTRANTREELEEKFGVRRMLDGIVRNQSWCKRCRHGD